MRLRGPLVALVYLRASRPYMTGAEELSIQTRSRGVRAGSPVRSANRERPVANGRPIIRPFPAPRILA